MPPYISRLEQIKAQARRNGKTEEEISRGVERAKKGYFGYSKQAWLGPRSLPATNMRGGH